MAGAQDPSVRPEDQTDEQKRAAEENRIGQERLRADEARQRELDALASRGGAAAQGAIVTGKAFIDPDRDVQGQERAYTADLANRLKGVEDRKGVTMNAAQVGPAREYAGATIAQNERSMGATLGPAAQGSAAVINRGEDTQFRGDQRALAGQLQAQAAGAGPSLAAGQLRQATDRTIKQQMAMAAASAGTNPALAQRNAAIAAAGANQQAGADAAQMKIQEQLNAQQQLAGVLNAGRAQDIGVAGQQAGFQQQVGLANMDAQNQFGLKQADLTQQNQQFNAGQTNTFNQNQAAFGQQAGLASMDAANKFAMQNAANEQQARANNQIAEMQQRGMNDAQISDFLSKQEADLARARGNMIAENTLVANHEIGVATINAQQEMAAAQREQQLIGAGISGAASLGGAAMMAFSDVRTKTNVNSLAPGGDDPDKKKEETPEEKMGQGVAKAGAAIGAAMQSPSSVPQLRMPGALPVNPHTEVATRGKSSAPGGGTISNKPSFGDYMEEYGNAVSDPGAKTHIQSLARALKGGK